MVYYQASYHLGQLELSWLEILWDTMGTEVFIHQLPCWSLVEVAPEAHPFLDIPAYCKNKQKVSGAKESPQVKCRCWKLKVRYHVLKWKSRGMKKSINSLCYKPWLFINFWNFSNLFSSYESNMVHVKQHIKQYRKAQLFLKTFFLPFT